MYKCHLLNYAFFFTIQLLIHIQVPFLYTDNRLPFPYFLSNLNLISLTISDL